MSCLVMSCLVMSCVFSVSNQRKPSGSRDSTPSESADSNPVLTDDVCNDNTQSVAHGSADRWH